MAPFGEVDWVRNLRAAGRATITARGREEEVTALELGPAEAVAFFRDVLGPRARRTRVGTWIVRNVDQIDIDNPVEAAEGRPVFELRPRRSGRAQQNPREGPWLGSRDRRGLTGRPPGVGDEDPSC